MRLLYRLALLAFPRGFRARFGDDLVAAFDAYRDLGRNPVSRLLLGLRAVLEAVGQGMRERFAPGGRRGLRQLTTSTLNIDMSDRLGWFVKDFKFALRGFRRSPGYTVTALAILALGIGASTSVFSVVNALVFRGAPFPDAHRLVSLNGTFQPEGSPPELRSVSYPDFLDWRDRTTAFESAAILDFANLTLTAPDVEPALVATEFASPAIFPMLGVRPMHGRLLAEDDDQVGNLVAVLGHTLWSSRFGGDPDVVGRTITVNDRVVTIIGVAEASFEGIFGGTDLWIPFKAEGAFVANRPSTVLERRGIRGFDAVARLKNGVTVLEAQLQLDQVVAGLREAGSLPPERGGLVVNFEQDNLGDARSTAWVLAVAVGLVLLIACANLANLLLARQVGRAREIGMRQALGATRADLVRQVLVESLTLGLSGGLLGAAVASWLTDALAPETVTNLPTYIAPTIDVAALVFAIGVAVTTGVLFGLLPALNTSRLAIVESLRSGSRTMVGSGTGGANVRRALVVLQIAVAVPLLVGSGLMIRSISNTLGVDTGFDPTGVTAGEITLPNARYDNEARAVFVRQLRSAIESHAVVRSATIATDLPLNRGYSATTVQLDDPRFTDHYRVYVHRVSPRYFETLGIRVLDGREFTDQDRVDSPEVVIVSRQFAERFWPGASAVGQTIEGARIVGVVENASYRGLVPDAQSAPLDPDIFLPLDQAMSARLQIGVLGNGPTAQLARVIRDEVRRLDPSLPVYGLTTLVEVVQARVAANRAATTQLGAFGVMALFLAAAGLFGVMAYTVGRRTNEIGVRMALGAGRADVIRMFLSQSLLLVLVGLGTGLALAAAGGRLLENQLYGVATTDLGTFASVTGAFIVVGLIASAIPAWRASRVDPLISLRSD